MRSLGCLSQLPEGSGEDASPVEAMEQKSDCDIGLEDESESTMQLSFEEGAAETQSDSAREKGQPRKKIPCTYSECKRRFNYPSDRDTHVRKTHLKDLPLPCTYPHCKRRFLHPSALDTHIRKKHIKDNPVPCTYSECKTRFMYPSERDIHIRAKHLKCQPKRRFQSRKGAIKRIPCTHSECETRFIYRSELDAHIRKTHLKDKPIPCTYSDCKVRFMYPSERQTHIRAVHNKERPFPHAHCWKSYSHQSHLDGHIKEVHDIVLRHSCPIAGCFRAFYQKTEVGIHIKLEHESSRFPCTVEHCDKSYLKESAVRRHI